MSSSGFTVVTCQIEAEKVRKHIGTASISFDVFDFPYSRELDPKNVERLKRLFRTERGCIPGDLQNRIPAVISEGQLQECLTFSGKTVNELRSESSGEYAKLEFPSGIRLECLQGRHRVKAAEEILGAREKRWVVDLFLADMTQDLKSALIEEYTNEWKPSDGEFYYKIRSYQGVFGPENPYFERRWWARLAAVSTSTNKRDRLEQLFRHRKFAPAFDAFRYIPVLYSGMRLSVFNKIVSMRCLEELLSFLRHTKDFWYYIFNNDTNAMQKLDLKTLQAVQLTAPGAFQADADSLYGRIKSGELFGSFDEAYRDEIWTRLCEMTRDFLVPSLFAFFENWKYLKGPADCMKRLIHLERGETIYAALDNAFRGADHDEQRCAIQLSRSAFRYVSANLSGRFDTIYRQLWLFAIREYMDMPADSTRKLAIPGGSHVNENVLFEFASLAKNLGVESEQINRLLERDPDREVARRLLTTARKPERYKYQNLETLITQVVSIISSAQPLPSELENGGNEIDDKPRPPKRCGIPNEIDQLRDKSCMFLPKLHAPMETNRTIHSFFIQRSMYFAFFGKQAPVDLQNISDFDGDTEMIQLDQVSSKTVNGHSAGLLEYQKLEERHHDLKITVQRLEKEMTEEEGKLRNILLEGQAVESKLNRMKQEEIEQSARLEKLKGEEQEYLTRLQQLKLAQQNQESANQTVADRTHEFTSKEEELQSRVKHLVELESTRLSSLKELNAREKRLKREVEKLTSQIERLKQEESTRQAAVVQLALERDGLTKELQKLKENISELEREQNDRKLDIERLMTKEREYQSAVGNLHPENNSTGPGTAQTNRVLIKFLIKLQEILVDPSDLSKLEKIAKEHLQQKSALFDCRGRVLNDIDGIFDKITQSGENVVYVVPQWQPIERKRKELHKDEVQETEQDVLKTRLGQARVRIS